MLNLLKLSSIHHYGGPFSDLFFHQKFAINLSKSKLMAEAEARCVVCSGCNRRFVAMAQDVVQELQKLRALTEFQHQAYFFDEKVQREIGTKPVECLNWFLTFGLILGFASRT